MFIFVSGAWSGSWLSTYDYSSSGSCWFVSDLTCFNITLASIFRKDNTVAVEHVAGLRCESWTILLSRCFTDFTKLGADPLQKLRGIHAVFSSVLTSPQMAEPQVIHGDPWWPGWARRRDCESCWRVSVQESSKCLRVILMEREVDGNAALDLRPERSNQGAVKMAPWQSHYNSFRSMTFSPHAMYSQTVASQTIRFCSVLLNQDCFLLESGYLQILSISRRSAAEALTKKSRGPWRTWPSMSC